MVDLKQSPITCPMVTGGYEKLQKTAHTLNGEAKRRRRFLPIRADDREAKEPLLLLKAETVALIMYADRGQRKEKNALFK